MVQNTRNDLILSEALQTLVDNGQLSEGSDAYLAAQKVVRDGEGSLDPQEKQLFEQKVRPRLGW